MNVRTSNLLISLSEKLNNELERHAGIFIWERPYLREELEEDFTPIGDIEKERSRNNLAIEVLEKEIKSVLDYGQNEVENL